MEAYQRQYENENSWEELQEDEFGRLLSLVRHNLPPCNFLSTEKQTTEQSAGFMCMSSALFINEVHHHWWVPVIQACAPWMQDTKEEQRAKRRRLISAAASARIKRGMIRYLQVLLQPQTWILIAA